jgi:hypothetical protein
MCYKGFVRHLSRSLRLTLFEVPLGLSHRVGHMGKAQHANLVDLGEGRGHVQTRSNTTP